MFVVCWSLGGVCRLAFVVCWLLRVVLFCLRNCFVWCDLELFVVRCVLCVVCCVLCVVCCCYSVFVVRCSLFDVWGV